MSNESNKQTNVYSVKWEAGYHPSFSGTIYDVVATGACHGCYSVQFFMGSNKTTKKRSIISIDDILKTKKLLQRFPMNVFSHFPYTGGLIGSATSLAWNGDEKQDISTLQIIKALEYELSILSNFDTKKCGVVIHPGSYRGDRRYKKGMIVPEEDTRNALITIAKSINKINFTPSGKLLLENCAGEGTKLPRTFEQLKIIFDHIDDDRQNNVGVCVDTAHIWGVGNYNLSRIDEVDRMFDDFDRILGLNRFTLLHLNDSRVEFGAHVDAHACLGEGHIWGGGFESLVYLLDKCKRYNIPMILETHGLDMVTLSALSVI